MPRHPLTAFRLPLDERATADRLAAAADCSRTSIVRAGIALLALQNPADVRRHVEKLPGRSRAAAGPSEETRS
jgi:hypothetical protein